MDNAFPLIVRPDRQTRRQRWGFRLFTVLAWALWIYLWLPLVTLVAWLIGFDLARTAIPGETELEYLRTLRDYGLWIASLATAFMLWSAYNLRRFRGKERRKQVGLVKPEDVAADLPISTEAVRGIMNSRKVTVHFNEKDEPTGATVKIRGEDRLEDLH